MSGLANQIGIIASLLTVLSFLPQVVKIWRSQDAAAISLRMYLLLFTATGLWAWFGVLIGSAPVIVTNAVCFVLQGSILVLKLRSPLNKLG